MHALPSSRLTVLLHIPVAGSEQTGGHGNRPAAIEAVYLGSIGGGPLKGHFRFPRGIAVDEAGRVFVADNYCRVQVFDADGHSFTCGAPPAKALVSFAGPLRSP